MEWQVLLLLSPSKCSNEGQEGGLFARQKGTSNMKRLGDHSFPSSYNRKNGRESS